MTPLHIGARAEARQTWDDHSGTTRLPDDILQGIIVYINRKRRWVTIQGKHYRESFWMEEVRLCVNHAKAAHTTER